jgi:hypothetical protein
MSISAQVLDISEYNEEPTVANGYTLVSKSYGGTTSVLLSTPYTLGIQTFTSINIQTHGFIQFLNTAYPTVSSSTSESLSGFFSKYGIAVPWDDLSAQADGAIGYKYANNNTQIIVNYSSSPWGSSTLKVQAKVTINLDNHPTSPGSIRIAYGLLQNAGNFLNTYGGVIGVSYGPASTTTTANTMNYVVSDTPTTFVYPNVPVQLFTGTGNNYLTNKTIVYNIQAPNRAPVLSNNITISEIYGETIHNVNLNDYTTDSDSSLSDVVYTLDPNGSSAMPNNTTLRFWMRDSYGDGWNGGTAVIKNSNNSVVATLTGPSSSKYRTWIFQDIVLSGVNTITWTGGVPSENQLFITSPSYSWSTSNGNPPAVGANVYYSKNGATSGAIDTLNFKTAKSLLGVSISGSILTLNSTLYNCDEFYITAKNTEKTYTSNTAKCSFTRLTDQQIAEAAASAISGFGELTSAIVTSSLNNNPRPRVIIIGYSSVGASAFLNVSTVTAMTIPTSAISIGANAFQGMSGLSSITIRSSVTSIGASAFQGSGIKSVIIEYGMLAIPASAFQYATTVTSITIPSSVTSIGASAFQGMTGLTSITIPSSVTSIGSNAFQGSGIKSVIIQSGMLVIPTSAFQDATTITSITIPSSVTSIGASAFQGMTGLTSITISSSVISIGSNAFSSSGITTAIFAESTLLDGLTIIPDGNTKILYGKSGIYVSWLTKVFNGSGELNGATELLYGATSARIVTTYSSIGESAFQGATGLTSITIPSSVTSIGASAFKGASGLTSITIPSLVRSIGASAFQGMTGITSITIPSSVTSIGESAFQGMAGVKSITIPSSVTSIGASVFQGMTGLTSITIPSSIISIGSSAFQGATGLTFITIPLSVTSIGANAFLNSGIKSVIIQSGMLVIPTSAFQDATTITSITIPSSVKSIGASAFQGMSGLTSITIPSSVTSIGASAFQGMTGLTSITIPSSVTSIGLNAFQGSGIISATFESSTLLDGLSITTGPDKTLYGKSSMSIYLSYYVFNGAGQLTSTIVTDNLLSYVRNLTITGFNSIGASAFQGANGLTSINIPSSVTSIGENTFQNSGLTSAIFAVNTYFSTLGIINTVSTQTLFGKAGVNVSALDTKIFNGSGTLSGATVQLNEATNVIIQGYTSIGSNAFQYASNITSITIPNGVTYIDSYAFDRTTSLTSITIPASVTFISATYSPVFQYALSLTTFIVDQNNPNYSSDSYGVLYDKNKTTIIQYPVGNTQTSYIVPSTVITITLYAFYGAKNLKSVTLPSTSTFTSIQQSAFNNATGLTSITIPSTVTSIEYNAFFDATSLKTVTFAGTSTLKTISSNAFLNATSLTSITIPASVTSISTSYVFKNTLSLTSINVDLNNQNYSSDDYGVLYNKAKTILIQYPLGNTQTSYIIPSTVTAIGTWPFYGAKNLKSVTLPSTFTSIQSRLFEGALGLESITIPSSVTLIDSNAFLGATNLTTVSYAGTSTLRTISSYAFQDAASLTSITIPASVTSISTPYTFPNTQSLTSINVDPNNQNYSSDNGVLYDKNKTIIYIYPANNSQTSYIIPSTVTSIPYQAFYGAKNLKSVTLPSTLSSIGQGAFQYATGLTSITIPSTVTNISSNAFYGATSLKTVTFAGTSTLKTIDQAAFQNMTSLTSINIPASVTNINITYGSVFQNAISLTSINVDPNNQNYSSDNYGVLYNKDKTSIIQYPLGSSQTSYAIPSTVSALGNSSVFNGENNLISITCDPNSTILSTDSYGVLYDKAKAIIYHYPGGNTQTSYTIPSTVTSISTYAFQRAKYLKSITVEPTNNYFSSDSNGVLFNKIRTNLIQYPLGNTQTTYSIPLTVTNIASYSFQDAINLTSATIQTSPSSTTIQDYAFQNAISLKTITMPNSVGYNTSLSRAFQGSGLTSAKFESVINYSTIAIQNKSTPQYFLGKENVVVSIIVPALVLNGFGELTSTIVSSILNNNSEVIITGYTSIGESAFLNAYGLTSITIPSSVTRIGANAFQGMTGLTSVTIPSSVTSIGASAFLSSGLTAATFAVSTYFSSFGLTNTASTQPFFGKSGVVVTALDTKVLNGNGPLNSATSQLAGETRVVIESFTSIGANAFLDALGVTSITIPSSVTSIGASAFQGMTGLTTIAIPSSVTSIGASAFQGMTGLTTIAIPSSVTSIGASAFENTALTTAFFESASTVNTLDLLNGDLINGYIVPLFFGKASVTVRYSEAKRAPIIAAPAAVISNSAFTSLFTSLNVYISNITTEIIPNTNDPYVEYKAKLTIPDGDLSTLSYINKVNIINTVKALYAAQLGVNVDKVIVTLRSGSIIVDVNVLNDGITEAMVPICFPKGTPITTNQGVIAIEKLNTDIHTIRGKNIVAITHSRPLHKYIISIEKDALGKNVPSAPIQISKEHKVFYKGKMVKANDLVEMCEGVTRIPYNGETLYNVLMEKHDNMMINNVICETLDPKNIMAKICGGKYNLAEQDKICKELNDIIKTDNIPAYKKLYASLK